MIIEMRTYTLQPGTLAEVEKRFGEALPIREKHSRLAAFWHTEVGPLNQIIHVWAYENFEHRASVRAAATKEQGWPPPIREFVTAQHSEVFCRRYFRRQLNHARSGHCSRSGGPLAAGAIPGLIERWSEKIEGRQKFSPLVGGWYSEFGALNKWVHIWAYKDANERFSVRAAAAATGQWPARNPPGVVVKQENAFVMPSAFSPIR